MVVTGVAAAASCGRAPPPSPLPGYGAELAALAGTSPAPESAFVPPPYPDAAERRLPAADVRIGVGRFLDLRVCGLRRLVAERNSALGRLESDGLRLVYEHNVLAGLSRCRAQLQSGDDPALAAALGEALEAKRAAAAATLWNATFGSTEMARTYRVSAPPLDPGRTEAGPVMALRGLAATAQRFGQPAFELDRKTHLDRLGTLEVSGHGGRLAKAVGRAAEDLRAATDHLRALPCGTAGAPAVTAARARFAHGDIGQWLEDLTGAARAWHAALGDLLSAQTAWPPPGFVRYHDRVMATGDAALVGELRVAVEDHRAAWRTAGRCPDTEG